MLHYFQYHIYSIVSRGLQCFFIISCGLQLRAVYLFFRLLNGLRDIQSFLGYVLLTKLCLHSLFSLKHHVHIRHRRDYDEQKAVVVVQASSPLTTASNQGRAEVRWSPGQEASLAHLCSNLRSFRSKSTVLKKVLVILSVFRRPRCDSAPGELCLPCPPKLRPTPLVPIKRLNAKHAIVHEGISEA